MVEPSQQPRWRERLNISRLAIRRPWLTVSFWLGIAVAGILAFSSFQYALFPDITFPVVVVNASAPLSTALDTEQQLTLPIEQELEGLAGVTDVGSTSYPGQSVVNLRFEVGTNLAQSTQQVEEALADLQLPPGATSRIIPINLNEASVASYAIESNSQDLESLQQITRDRIVSAIAALPGVLRVDVLGEPVEFNLTQLSDPTQAFSQAGTLVRFNGNQALAIQIIKQGEANTLEVAQAVEDTIQELQAELPEIQISLAATQADYIREATGSTIDALILAIIIASLVIFPFLWDWRATVISALAIPASLLGTFIVMAIFGFNLETITLLALALIVGSIVDDAIVDVENICRHIERGEPPRQAAMLATDEIGLTVAAATFTVAAVFIPVGNMGGVLGQFFRPFGLTISAAMLISMLVARTLSPMLAAYWLKPKAPRGEPQTVENQPTSPTGFHRRYRNLLHWALEHRWFVVGISILSLVIGIGLIPLIPKGFIPKLDRGEFNITYTAPLPQVPPELLASLNRTSPPPGGEIGDFDPNQLPEGFDPAQLPPGVDPTQIPPGEGSPAAPNLPAFNPLDQSLQVARRLDEFVLNSPEVESVYTVVGSRQGEPNRGNIYVRLKRDRTLSTADIQDRFRTQLPRIAGVSTSIEDIQFVDTGGEKPVQLRIVGEDLAALNQAANQIRTRLEDIPGLEDVSTTADENAGGTIQQIHRNDGRRIATISANLGQGIAIGEATDLAVAQAQAVLPPEITLDLGGDSARVNEILRSFGSTLALSLICMVIVLFIAFRSVTDTLVIFFSLPLSVVGAMLGLLIVQSDFGMISLIGLIFLLGLTDKNAVLIVDYVNQLRHAGKSRREAILEAVPTRLRPILMTVTSTILGMLPIALGIGAGSELRAPMAVAIIGGLVTSTLLSLIVVPVIYDLLDDAKIRLTKRKT
ncbi:efflux RND transporter permease subunit [Geitlerinema splendidum]|nr:efflux RND transporter permease subunit [Geitlerinema splendidum]